MAGFLSRASALALLLGLAGCGGSATPDRPDAPARILLNSSPAAVHAGIYLSRSRGYDLAEGVELAVRARRPASDPRRLLETGRVDFAIVDLAELARLRADRAPLVGVMAVMQRDPHLLLVTTQDTLTDHRSVVTATIRTLQRGYAEATNDPESAVTVMVDAVRGLDRAELAAELDDVAPDFTGGERFYGRLDAARLRAAARDLDPPLDVEDALDTTLVGPIRTE